MLRRIIRTPQGIVVKAKDLRQRMTEPEKVLWHWLQDKKFFGFKFRRQTPLGPYIADFLCSERMLIIEVDGDIHKHPEKKTKDKEREQYLAFHGFRLIRFTNADVLHSTEEILTKIKNALLAPHPSPLPEGEGV